MKPSGRTVSVGIVTGLLMGAIVLLAQPFNGTLLTPNQATQQQNPSPPAKQSIEDQYAQEREEGHRNPAPSDPNAPIPSIHGPTFKLGIIEECDPYPARTFRTVNCWQGLVNGSQTVVYAGARSRTVDSQGNEIEEPDPQQGMVVSDPRGEGETKFLPTPERAGAVNVVAERNGVLTLVSETGRSFSFDVRTGTFTSLDSFACPRGLGFWKNKPGVWPVPSLTLGNDIYTQEELLIILKSAVGSRGGADASLILAHQLISAKLSISDGSDPAPINKSLLDADRLLIQFYNDKDKLPFKVSPSSSTGQAMVHAASALDRYNNGGLTLNCAP